MKQIAKNRGVSIVQIALAWCNHKKRITSVIIGAKTQEQLIANINSTKIKLTSDELSLLDGVSKFPLEYPGWMLIFQQSDRLNNNNG